MLHWTALLLLVSTTQHPNELCIDHQQAAAAAAGALLSRVYMCDRRLIEHICSGAGATTPAERRDRVISNTDKFSVLTNTPTHR